MRVGVVGSRESNEKQKEVLFQLLAKYKNDIIVSGGCTRGADKWAEQFADINNMKKIIYLPNGIYPEHFHRRNHAIAENIDMLIATIPEFPNLKRYAGTEQTAREAINRGIPVILINVYGGLIKYNH